MRCCEHGHVYDEEKFSVCPFCFVAESAARPVQARPVPPDNTPEVQLVSKPETPPRKKRPGRAKWFVILGAAAVLLGAVLVLLLPGERAFVTNEMPEVLQSMEVPAGYAVYDSAEGDFSFLYPKDCVSAWTGGDGAYIYTTGIEEPPYILVYRSQGSRPSPDAYFEQYKALVKNTLDGAQFQDIAMVEVEGKTLYMLRCEIEGEGSTYTIDRYLELYGDSYVQYTVKSYHAGSEDGVLYGIVTSLYPQTGVYNAGASLADYDESATVENAEVGISMAFPVSMDVRQIPVGLLAAGDDLMLFASYNNTSADGAAIYDREDFLNCCAANPELLPTQLGLDGIAVDGGTAGTLGGYDAYCYPIEMLSGSFHGYGMMYVLEGGSMGCYLVYYAVSDAASEQEALSELAAQYVDTFSITGDPAAVRSFAQYDHDSFSVLLEQGLVSGGTLDTGSGLAFYLTDDEMAAPLVVEAVSGAETAEGYISSYIAQRKNDNPDIAYTIGQTENSGGRYMFETCELAYAYGDKDWTISLSIYADDRGNLWQVYFTCESAYLDTYTAARDDALWSFRLN